MSLCGCEAIRDRIALREDRRADNYTLGLIYARRPALRGKSLSILESQWTGKAADRASYLYALVRFAADPDSHYRIIIVEQRITHPGERPFVTLRDGLARAYWHYRDENFRERRHAILSPQAYKPNPNERNP